MEFGYNKVLNALNSFSTGRPPKGELLVANDFISDSPYPDMSAFLDTLNADLVTLPVNTYDKNLIRHFSDKKLFVFGLFEGPFTALINTLGLQSACHHILKRPKETEAFMRDFLQRKQKHKISQALNNGCHGLIIADDLAGNHGMLVSPKYLNDFYFPIFNDLFEDINYKNTPFIFHSDGDIRDIFIPLKQCGFKGVQGLQPSAEISASCFDKKIFRDWVFWGNFELETGSRLKTCEEVVLETAQLIKEWACFPGYIFGTSGGLYKGLTANEIKAAYETVDS